MKFPYTVKHNDKFYKAGEDVPMDAGEVKEAQRQQENARKQVEHIRNVEAENRGMQIQKKEVAK